MKDRLMTIFLPNRGVSQATAWALLGFWAALALLAWVASPWESLPGPGEVYAALAANL